MVVDVVVGVGSKISLTTRLVKDMQGLYSQFEGADIGKLQLEEETEKLAAERGHLRGSKITSFC